MEVLTLPPHRLALPPGDPRVVVCPQAFHYEGSSRIPTIALPPQVTHSARDLPRVERPSTHNAELSLHMEAKAISRRLLHPIWCTGEAVNLVSIGFIEQLRLLTHQYGAAGAPLRHEVPLRLRALLQFDEITSVCQAISQLDQMAQHFVRFNGYDELSPLDACVVHILARHTRITDSSAAEAAVILTLHRMPKRPDMSYARDCHRLFPSPHPVLSSGRTFATY